MRFSLLDIGVGLSVLIVVPVVMYVMGYTQPIHLCAVSIFLSCLAMFAASLMKNDGEDPDAPVEVASLADQFEATSVIGHLETHGIKACPVGSFVSGFQVEAPRDVKVVVARKDSELARQILSELTLDENEVDWSNVDIGRRER